MHKHLTVLFCAASVAIAAPALAAPKSKLKVKPNAPARYVVKQGDTLWNISGKYLYRPWQWPALWNVNRSKVRNPHLIYPGQELHLTYVNGRPVLRAGKRGGKGGGIPTIKLRPGVQDVGSGYGIPTLNVDFYRLFMKHPQFVAAEEIAHAPRIVAGGDGRTLYSKGDRIYADGPIESGEYLVFRVKQDLTDPVTGKSLGKLVEFSGEVSTLAAKNTALDERDDFRFEAGTKPEKEQKLRDNLREDEYYAKVGNKTVPVRTAQPMVITDSVAEIMKGDYLLPKPEAVSLFNIMPHAPDQPVQAAIIDSVDGISESGFAQTVILNRGEADGVDAGTVLSVYKPNRVVKSDWVNPDKKAAQFVNLPSEEVGLAMVYRTGPHVASAIILESKTNVSRGDILREPGQDMDADADTATNPDGLLEEVPSLKDDAELKFKDVWENVK